MADNIDILDAHGNVQSTATDQVGMAHIQKIKIVTGESDSGIMVLAGEGSIENALRVVLGGDKLVIPYSAADNLVTGVSADIVDTTPVQLIAAPGAGISIYITSITVTNDSSVGTVVKFTDGISGTAKFRSYAVGDGGGFTV
jgi:hypothetical protein